MEGRRRVAPPAIRRYAGSTIFEIQPSISLKREGSRTLLEKVDAVDFRGHELLRTHGSQEICDGEYVGFTKRDLGLGAACTLDSGASIADCSSGGGFEGFERIGNGKGRQYTLPSIPTFQTKETPNPHFHNTDPRRSPFRRSACEIYNHPNVNQQFKLQRKINNQEPQVNSRAREA
ncbi:hypothetical protein Nepgr_026541 [Nepenthes gracilis]|uniref:Uncharacterized protein n=1 Tax=Nepenthes gracilis TaxID=150966 RepID=A0AAD3T898_NEPGR|nr:hypothetical protein Nepgr_026541 [Nepenthes gracilis]